MATKRHLQFALGALVLVGVALQFAPRGTRGYRAVSIVVARPYTNTLFARSFESHVIRTIPSVLALRVTPKNNAVPGRGVPVRTNGVFIVITCVGPTPEDAELAANEAATQICQIVSTNYGVASQFYDRALGARKYSYFRDSFQPAVGRWFKH